MSLVIGPCNHCLGEIEFEAPRHGKTVVCPHCAKLTVLSAANTLECVPQTPTRPPSVSRTPATAPQQNRHGETVYFGERGITVTNARFIVGPKTFTMSGITGVELGEIEREIGGHLALVCVAILGLAGGLAQGLTTVAIICGLVIAAMLFAIYKTPHIYALNITSASGTELAVQDKDKDFVLNIARALHQAIIDRS